jgi:hypothetical protein
MKQPQNLGNRQTGCRHAHERHGDRLVRKARTLVEITPDADIFRGMISFDAERLMELEVGALTVAARGEKRALLFQLLSPGAPRQPRPKQLSSPQRSDGAAQAGSRSMFMLRPG